MRHYLKSFAVTLAFALAPIGAFAANFGPLVSAEDLNAEFLNAKPLILDIRQGNTAEGAPIFEAGHITGAVHAPYALFRGSKENPGAVPVEENLEAVLQKLGVTKDRPIIIAHQGKNATDFGAAARVYWTLKSSGIPKLSILDGGVNAWSGAGYALDTGAGASVTPSNIDITFNTKWLATTEDVQKLVESPDVVDLVDARPAEFWEGNRKHNAALRPGTLPHSRFFRQDRWFGGADGVKIDSAALNALLEEGDFGSDHRTIVSFCNTGHWAATNWFVLSEVAELRDVKLYAGSMVEYSQSEGPMANVPGAVRNLWNKFRGYY